MSRISSKIVYNDLTGGINNVNGIETINTTTKKTETPDMVNIEYLGLGGIKTMEGNIQFANQLPSKVVGGWEYVKNGTRYMVVGLSNGEVYIYDVPDNEFKLIYTFQHNSDRMSFCNMNNGVVVTNGVDDPFFYEKGRHTTLEGTVAITANDVNVVGTSTQFTVQLHKSDRIEIDDVIYIVDTITDDTHLALTTDAESTKSGELYYLSEISQCNATLINSDDPLNQPADIRGLAINFYKGRLWIGDKNSVYYSQVGLYNGWDQHYDAGYIASLYNDTSPVKALGLYADYLLIHKEHSTYIVTSDDGYNFTVKPYSNITCESQQSFIVSNTKYYVYSDEYMDIYPLVQRTQFQDRFLGETISQKVRNFFHNVRTADVDKIFCVAHPKKRWMMFYMPTIQHAGSNYALIFDFQTKSWLLRVVPQNVTCAFNFDNEVYIGTDDGKVLREFEGLTFDGEVLEAYYKSPWFDWANGYTQSFAEFQLELDSSYNNHFYIRTFKDGTTPYEDRIINSEFLTGNALVYNTDKGDTTYHINFYNTIGYKPTDYYAWSLGSIIRYTLSDEPEASDQLYSSPNTTSNDTLQTPIYSWTYNDGNDDVTIYTYAKEPEIGDYVYTSTNYPAPRYGTIDSVDDDGFVFTDILSNTYTTQEFNGLVGIIIRQGGPGGAMFSRDVDSDTSGEPYTDQIYALVDSIPDTDENASQDTDYYVSENLIFYFTRDDVDLKVSTYNLVTKEETDYITISNYFNDVYASLELDDVNTNLTKWDNDQWVSGEFQNVRMLLPNNVFEDFQLEFGANRLGQAFAINQYNFRRVEHEEAPW